MAKQLIVATGGVALSAWVVYRSVRYWSNITEDGAGLRQFVVDFCAGGVAGAVAKTATAPLEVAKLVVQCEETLPIDEADPLRNLSTVSAMVMVVRERGVLGLWSGNTINVLRYFPTQAFNFAFKDLIKNMVPRYDPSTDFWKFFAANMASGCAAGGLSLLWVYPLDTARTLLAVRPEFATDTLSCVAKLYEYNGLRAVFSGLGPSIVGVAAYRGPYFAIFDTLKALNPLKEDKGIAGLLSKFAIAQITSVVAGFVSYPFDTVRRHMQIAASFGSLPTAWATLGNIVATGGVSGLFVGFTANVLRTLCGALVLVAYDEMKSFDHGVAIIGALALAMQVPILLNPKELVTGLLATAGMIGSSVAAPTLTAYLVSHATRYVPGMRPRRIAFEEAFAALVIAPSFIGYPSRPNQAPGRPPLTVDSHCASARLLIASRLDSATSAIISKAPLFGSAAAQWVSAGPWAVGGLLVAVAAVCVHFDSIAHVHYLQKELAEREEQVKAFVGSLIEQKQKSDELLKRIASEQIAPAAIVGEVRRVLADGGGAAGEGGDEAADV